MFSLTTFVQKIDEEINVSWETHVKLMLFKHICFSQGNEFAMYIFLPNKIDGLNTLLSKLNEDSLVLIQEEMLRKEVMVAIPKFRFDTAINLSDTLQEVNY